MFNNKNRKTRKRIAGCLMVLVMMFSTLMIWAGNEELSFTEYELGVDEMHISLPDGWYFNTARKIDEEFLKVSENSRRKLSQYMADNDIDYNLVSKDLLEEINIIFINSSQSKMMHNFTLLNEDVLTDRAQAMIDLGVQEDKGIRTTYDSYRLEKVNEDCIFMIFEGTVETEEQKAGFYQYTTMINGYGVTCTYRGYEGADYEAGKSILDQIAHSFRVDEIKEVDLKTNAMRQIIAPAVLVVGFVCFTIFLFVRQIRKNKKEEQQEK